MYIFKYSLEVSTKYLIEALTFNFLGNYIRAFTGTPNKVAILRQVSCFIAISKFYSTLIRSLCARHIQFS